MLQSLMEHLVDPEGCFYVLHTPLGEITVSAWHYAVPGFIAVGGQDKNKNYRFLVFSEEQTCTFPLEVKRKDSNSSIGLKA